MTTIRLRPGAVGSLFKVIEEFMEFGGLREIIERNAGIADRGDGAAAVGKFTVEVVVDKLVGAAEGAGEFHGGE
jgi:hypothetical protein